MNRILALIDLSDAATPVADAAARMALAFGAGLVLLHVSTPDADYEGDHLRDNYSRDGIAAELHRARRRLRMMAGHLAQRGITARPLLARSKSVRGVPRRKIRHEIIRLRPDLIVVGAGRQGWLHRLLGGSTLDTVLRSLPCPVLIVPTPATTPATTSTSGAT